METNFFSNNIQNQLQFLKDNDFFNKSSLEQTIFLRKLGFFNLSVQERIDFLENLGLFYLDINDDPIDLPLEPDKIDYLKESSNTSRKNRHANAFRDLFTENNIRRGTLRIKNVTGFENVSNLHSGAILACNHFNPFDTFSIEKVLRDASVLRAVGINANNATDKNVWKVEREGNYTNPPFPNYFGLYFKYSNTLPLSSNRETMKKFNRALSTILQDRHDLVIVCAEQAMWWNYRKPRPLKFGAYKWATDNNVPVIPIYISMQDSKDLDADGQPIQEYTINFGKPIFPNKNLSIRDNTINMRNSHFDWAKRVYESTYHIPLKYSTTMHPDLKEYITSTPNFDVLLQNHKRDVDFEDR